MCSNSNRRDRWIYDLRLRLVWTTLVTGLTGCVLGLVYFVLLYVLRDSLSAYSALVDAKVLGPFWFDLQEWRGPDALLGLFSLLSGWIVAWVAERTLGASGSVLIIPVVASVVASGVTVLGLALLLISPLPSLTYSVLVMSGIELLLGAGVRIYLGESLRW